jgi:hypothetical protein
MDKFTFSTGKAVTSNKVKNLESTLPELIDYFSNPKKLDVDIEAYSKLDKKDANSIKCKLCYWSGAIYNEVEGIPRRRRDQVSARNLLTFDIDHANEDTAAQVHYALANDLNINYIMHSSISHNPNFANYKYRLVIPCASNVTTPQVYEACYNEIAKALGYDLFDKGASIDTARAMFEPVVLKGQDYFIKTHTTANLYTPPTTDDKGLDINTGLPRTIMERKRPSELGGIRGAYNALHKCPELLNKYAPRDEYAPDNPDDPLNPEGRWTYRAGSGLNGIRFYEDGELLQSDHSTDPLRSNLVSKGCKQWTAYDLYTHFKHNGNTVHADAALMNDKAIMDKLAEDFEELESFIEAASDNEQEVNPLNWSELLKIRGINAPNEAIDFILKYGLVIAKGKVIELVFPIKRENRTLEWDNYLNREVKKVNHYLEFYNITYGTALENFLGYCGELADPQNPKKSIDTIKYLFKHSRSLKIYSGFCFKPYNKYAKKVVNPVAESDKVNIFNGYGVAPNFNYNDEVSRHNLDIILDYIYKVVCSEDDKANTWVLDWLADIVQNPANKPGTALVLYSAERGLGKSTLFVLLKAMLGMTAQNLPHDMLTRRFNANLSNCLLGLLDDVSFQAKKDAAKMRSLVTSEQRYIERKGVDGYEMEDCTRYLITSNHKHVVDVDASVEERRYTMLKLKNHFPLVGNMDTTTWSKAERSFNLEQRKKSKEYFDRLYSCIYNSADLFLGFLLDREITSNLRKMYATDLYTDVSHMGQKSIDQFLTELSNLTKDELIDTFEGNADNGFTESGTVVDIKRRCLYIVKRNFKDHYIDNYASKNLSGQMFNQELRNSFIVEANKIDFSGKAGKQLHHSFKDKRKESVIIPLSFFKGFTEEERWGAA